MPQNMFSKLTKPSQTSFECFEDVTKCPTQIPLRYAGPTMAAKVTTLNACGNAGILSIKIIFR